MKNPDVTEQPEAPTPVACSDLVRRLRAHIAMMAPHQKERRTGKLLIEATEIIEMLERVLESKLFNEKPSNA